MVGEAFQRQDDPAGPAALTDASNELDPATSVEPADPSAYAAPALLGVLWNDAEAAMTVLDQDQRIRAANPAALGTLELFGIGIGDTIGNLAMVSTVDCGHLYAPDELPVARALRGETVHRQTISVSCGQTQQPRRMVLSARPIPLADGSEGALLVWRDVTDSWHFAERSRIELARLGQLIEGASDYAIIMLDPAGQVISWTAAAERLKGYTREQAIGLPYESFFDGGDRARGLPQQILNQVSTTGNIQIEGKRLRRDGSVFWAHAALTAMRDEAGELLGFVKVTSDVSERRAAERAVDQLNGELQLLNDRLEERVAERTFQLEQQAADLAAVNAELEAFSYSVSHDLRAPLRAMSGFARIIEQNFGDQLPAEALHYLSRVTENAQEMGSLIDALLSFSRMQRQSMESSPIDMTQLVRECWATLAHARGDRRIEFELPELPAAEGDPRLIQQVWMNLLDNAIKYTGREVDARVEVGTQIGTGADDGEVLYVVRDNGAGFDMRYAAKIGQVFQRLHHQEDYPGTGIGLALVQRIVQRHGGRLTAIGDPGQGATFGFTLRGPG